MYRNGVPVNCSKCFCRFCEEERAYMSRDFQRVLDRLQKLEQIEYDRREKNVLKLKIN